MLKDILPPIVDGFTKNILAYAVLLAAVATITMALLELAKAMLRLRMFFHKYAIKRWLKEGNRFDELLVLAVGDNDSSSILFDQPTDKLMGQIQAASNVALEFPNVYPALYNFITYVPQPKAGGIPGKSDSDVWKEFSANMDSSQKAQPENLQQATQARARLDHFIARKLDAFQTQTEYRWARLNQTVAIGGSVVFIYFMLQNIGTGIGVSYSATQTLLLSVFGGMLAPFAKDVVAALSNLRSK